ncbi:MAG: ferric reductase-like transmembrane domain-containing protein [Rhodospirillaceae bacterium]|nr:ferric reductase-like transmembrane domain-containing protein [Rhodospirillaceae bacterium]
MRAITWTFWGLLALLSGAWLMADPRLFTATGFFAVRDMATQATGLLAIGCMSVAMVLAVRPRWPERTLGGLDKMYRLHKWLGIGGVVFAVLHWLWVEAPKWAVGWGLLERSGHGPREAVANPVEQALLNLRSPAEGIGEWAFYGLLLLASLALICWFPYRLAFKAHRLMAVAYLALAFHAVVLVKFSYWTTPVGLVLAPLLAAGVVSAVLVLFGRVGANRRVGGRIAGLRSYPGLHALEVDVALDRGWPGHDAGQFAFLTTDASEGSHPYTIASAWDRQNPHLTFVIKALGDHTSRLAETLTVGQPVTVEGPYGCFTFGEAPTADRQIWVGGGIGLTPFIARMRQLATGRTTRTEAEAGTGTPRVDFFHTTKEVDDAALARLATEAEAAGVRLHVLVDGRDGLLTGARIRKAVPDWAAASLWFCGPAGFGAALKEDFASHGLAVDTCFHQELFAMR